MVGRGSSAAVHTPSPHRCTVAASLAQQIMGNSPIDRVANAKITKAKERRTLKTQRLIEASKTWTASPYEDMKADVQAHRAPAYTVTLPPLSDSTGCA
jgi:hypothetical protein